MSHTDDNSSDIMPMTYQGVFLDDMSNKLTTPLFNSSIPFDHYPERARENHSPNYGDLSEFEAAILRSTEPIQIDETEEIEVVGARGIWANRSEVVGWKGTIPIENYPVNQDHDPLIVNKKTSQVVEYIQEMAIRYLKPPTPEPPGDIIISELPNIPTSPAPPVIIRQQPPRPKTPEPVIYRETPPTPPPTIGRKIITIAGKQLPPPPRKVVIERMAPLPEKPRSVLIERWLPYSSVKRKVIYHKSENSAQIIKPKNVIIQWEAPKVAIRRQVKYLGVVRANPADYQQRYGPGLKRADELPDYINDIKTPDGIVLAADQQRRLKSQSVVYELHGDVEALKLVDLDREGLSEYRDQLNQTSSTHMSQFTRSTYQISSSPRFEDLNYNQTYESAEPTMTRVYKSDPKEQQHYQKIYQYYQRQNDLKVIDEILAGSSLSQQRVAIEEAEKCLLRVSSQLGRRLGQEDVKLFFSRLDVTADGSIDSNQFKSSLMDIYAP